MQFDQAWAFRSGAGPVDDEGAHHPVWLGLLGSFRLLRHGRPVPVRSGGKTEALLTHLGLATLQGLPREALLRVVWPDSEVALAGNALNNLVHSLRRLLADALSGAPPVVQASGYYRLNHEAGVAVDVSQFKTLVARGEWHARMGDLPTAVALAARAVKLYRGDWSCSRNWHNSTRSAETTWRQLAPSGSWRTTRHTRGLASA